MKLLLFAVLLAVMRATPPVPRQTSNSASQTSHTAQTNAAEHKNQIAPTPSTQDSSAKQSVGDKASADNPTSANTEQSVRVRELPSVSVSRDWIDVTAWMFSAILVAVGIVGICAAYRTLKGIERQAHIMKRQTAHIARQTTHLQNSVIQATIAANATKLSADVLVASQRAWLDGEFRPKSTGVYDLIVSNHGPTPAQFLSWEISFHREGGEFQWNSSDSKNTHNLGMLVGGGKSTDSLHRFIPNENLLRDAGYTVAVLLVYLDVLNPKIEHRTRFAFHYTRRSTRLERLSQYNEYS